MKSATITLYKNLLLADIDAATFKRVDGVLAAEADQVKNAVSSDSEEALDMNLLHRYMETRDAVLRNRLSFCLVSDDEDLSVTNELEKDVESFDYSLNVPDTMTKPRLASLAKKMHNYIVQGVIVDWYAVQNMKGNVGPAELEDMETEITCMLRSSVVKRPLQPFGPRGL